MNCLDEHTGCLNVKYVFIYKYIVLYLFLKSTFQDFLDFSVEILQNTVFISVIINTRFKTTKKKISIQFQLTHTI